ncbi:hypothetical protein [Sansalvadorimonas verongulae]|uniref:hypothetical protein n=1 Tax=Sansalvadorimonas verongulae TaxID=2172824 RepID=UPI0012BBAF3A|nr:hypothetical protein [Sansalvadorimonas verongulae]MTI11639.1 hypothetical protein [Sansalvadorimonas verongulae]
MALVWKQQGYRQVGVNDPAVSPYCKCWIKQGDTVVVGVIAEGTSKELAANWNSPFEGDAVGSKFSKSGGLLQSGSLTESTRGVTTITTMASQQVWEGNAPHAFNVSLQLYALADPKVEVMDALMELERMATPEVQAVSPVGGQTADGRRLGRVPQTVFINIGRNVVYGPCVIESLQQPLDAPRSSDGYLMEALVNLTIQSETMLNRSQIAGTYG